MKHWCGEEMFEARRLVLVDSGAIERYVWATLQCDRNGHEVIESDVIDWLERGEGDPPRYATSLVGPVYVSGNRVAKRDQQSSAG
jgi:hypothetical protein